MRIQEFSSPSASAPLGQTVVLVIPSLISDPGNLHRRSLEPNKRTCMLYFDVIQTKQYSLVQQHSLLCHHLLAQVDSLASSFGIHLRTGCFCNTGACQRYLGITLEQVKKNLEVSWLCKHGKLKH